MIPDDHSLLPDARSDAAYLLLHEVASMPWGVRFLLAVIAGTIGAGVAIAGAALSSYRHWVAWTMLLLLIEPLALFLITSAVFLIAPNSIVGRLFVLALRRVNIAVAVFFGAVALGLTWMFAYVAIEAWRTWGPGQ